MGCIMCHTLSGTAFFISIVGEIGHLIVDYALAIDTRKASKKKGKAVAQFDSAAFVKYLIDAMAGSHTAGDTFVVLGQRQ